MHVRSRVLLELMSGVNIGRLHLAEQFSSMDGWQRQQDSRFDHYVQEKRSKEYFEDFDQRVERAFQAAAKAHRAELRNALKRRLRDKQDKFSASTMLEMRSAVEDRMKWLREVWAQVDADYRSNDAERQKRAAEEITAALRGEPGEYMKWVYEQARERRFLGDKGKAALDAELADAELPEVSDEEVNRYHNLKWSMTEIEHNVKSKFGVAGQQHWAELQAAKDDEYEQKLDTAAQVYQKLLDQNDRFDESRRTALLRSNVERIHQAQVRFKASMEMEANREQLVEAHRSMEEERTRIAKEQRVALLKEAAELKKSGVPNEEISLRLKERQLARQAQRQDEYRLRERESVQAKKNEYLRLIQQLRTDSEEREGRELLQPQRSEAGWQQRTHNVFGFADDDRSDVGGEMAASSGPAGHMAASHTEGDVLGMEASSSASPSTHRAIKKQLWDAIHDDKYEEPFLTVHQARLDAAKTYDPLYASHFPTSLAQGKKYSRQSMGTHAAGNEQDNEMMQKVNSNYFSYNWGVQTGTVHDLDGDGELDYLNQSTWHVRDKTTGDVDWRYERKKGGAVFRGPRFYRMGAERDAADPGERTMDPLPPPKRRLPSSPKSSSNKPLPFGRSN